MPVVDSFSQRPSSGPPHHNADDAWVMPLGKIAGLRLYVSYSVFVAAAVLIGIIALVHTRPGNSDLPWVALIGVGFWMLGWSAQIVVHLFARFVRRVSIDSLTIGLLGVETRNRTWPAKTALFVASSSLLTLLAVGGLLVLSGVAVNGSERLENAFRVWLIPGFGLGSADHVWLAGACLVWVQAICQLFPLPKSMGRVAIIATVSLASSRMDEPFQTHFARRALQMIALGTSLIALVSLLGEQAVATPQWPLLMLLALMLWVSSRGHDVRETILSFGAANSWEQDGFDPHVSSQHRPGWMTRTKRSIRSIGQRRRLLRALQQEHQEAEDAGRLDEVLNQLHTSGRESLSPSDLALLQRVSDNIRRQRQLEAASSDEPS